MNRTNRILPTYTGDVSGACSALFELGGMVVIHDPSGCNSTYNTHDETRWYDQDSLIFITGLVERDAILGNDQKLVDDVVDAAVTLRPRFVALCNSPVPFISGTDFPALCKIIERRLAEHGLDIPCLYVRTNGMHDYVAGAGNAFLALAHRFVGPADKTARAKDDSVVGPPAGSSAGASQLARRHVSPLSPDTLNILGATPLDLGIAGTDRTLRAFAREAGFDVLSCWAMGSTLDELKRADEAQVNLVVSATGLSVARWLNERFGTPYVVGFPVGSFAPLLADSLREAARTGTCSWPFRDVRNASCDGTRFAVGEPVSMASLATAAQLAGHEALRVVCPLEAAPELLGSADIATFGEEEAEAALANATLVVADELYGPVVPASARHVALPHQAFSGRNGWKAARDLTQLDVTQLLQAMNEA